MAPLSMAERKRRSRCRQTEEQKSKEREKAKNAMKSYRLKNKNDKKWKKKENEASKVRMRKMRAKKKTIKTDCSSTLNENAFTSPQTFGKAMKRTRNALPESPRKKVAIIKKVALELGIPILDDITKSKNNNGISDEVKEKVQAFYYQDEVSRQLPGKKDVKSIKDPVTNKKRLLQKRLLMYNLKDAYHLFKTENPQCTIGLSKFCELRPGEIEIVGSKDQQVCCCPYCENIAFLLRVCTWKNICAKTINDLIPLIVCDINSADCMKQKCNKCSSNFDHLITRELEVTDDTKVNQWNGGILEEKIFNSKSIIEEITQQCKKISEHIYNIKRQARELRKQKDDLEQNEILLQIDFAENYEIKHQNEVMAAHWRTDQNFSVTIYTAVIYYRKERNDDLEVQTYAIISNTKKHSSYEVKVFNDHIIDDFQKRFNISLKRVIIWSDGAAAHFKNRYSMALMSSSDIYSEWNFAESYHGKGPHDGVGATIKRHVWKKVLQSKSIIKTANEFYTELKSSNLNTLCIYVSQEEIESIIPEMEKICSNIIPIKGIHSAHSIIKINYLCVSQYTNTGDDKPFVEALNLLGKNKNAQGVTNIAKVSSTTILNDKVKIELEKYYGVYYDDKWYIGRIITYNQSMDTCKIKFLYESSECGFKWPTPDDIQMVNISFIMCGPLQMHGNLPFSISYADKEKLNKLYKNLKKKGK